MINVGIVCEGPRDLAILERLIKRIIFFVRPNEEVEIGCLQPTVDATSGKYDRGGWSQVVGWCTKYTNTHLSTFLDAPLFSGQVAYDLIVVQIDGDALELAGIYSRQDFIIPSATPSQRVTDVKSMLEEWLNPSETYLEKILYAVPVHETEAWMLSALSKQTLIWENISSPKEVFQKEFKAKAQSTYSTLAKQAEGFIDKITGDCISFSIFRADVETWAKR